MSGPAVWVSAARPATLWAAVVPVLVGGGLAWGAGREDIQCVTAPCPEGAQLFRWDVFVVTLLASLAIQIAANYANDASDAKRGADPADRIGPTRAVSSGLITSRQMWVAVWGLLGIAAVAGIYLAAVAGPVVIAIGVLSILATLGYVGGPKPYGYMGLGEVFVFLFFGVVATVGSRYVHDSTVPAAAWLLSIPVGLLVTAILVANNIRDIDTDAATGKRTLAVMLGRDRTVVLFTALVYGAFASIGIFAAAGWTPRPTAIALVAVVLAPRITGIVARERAGPPLIRALKGTARLHLAVGVLLAVGSAVA
ncbi:MAG: 1,4-dihydroxy-2-naphthoate polyprenyltransferase [Acidimicrobiia bacterium]|nr:1,4-dihydroxy-2-naphthoate polyprenyltransferase [Acidimicrobiia bacterium]MBT8215881.1 1,4-dihydroxy-2-naphthoate polyprenyltransferase [Acidimicrobiia bacterium]